jgi:large subunit ribosomal protein L28
MAKCNVCGKYGRSGNNVSHSMRHTKRRFMPNIQSATLQLGGKTQQVKLCTRCLRSYHRS